MPRYDASVSGKWRPMSPSAAAPKMAPHIAAMCANVAADLGVSVGQVNIKAKTNEKLGYLGREEGIAAEAVALLLRA